MALKLNKERFMRNLFDPNKAVSDNIFGENPFVIRDSEPCVKFNEVSFNRVNANLIEMKLLLNSQPVIEGTIYLTDEKPSVVLSGLNGTIVINLSSGD